MLNYHTSTDLNTLNIFKEKFTFIKSPMGSGKTNMLIKQLKGCPIEIPRVIYISFRISLAREVYTRFEKGGIPS
jgi:thymidine kinase